MSDRRHNSYNLSRDAEETVRRNIRRIEKLDDEKAAINDDIKDIYSEMKSAGFDVAAFRELMAERRKRKRLGDDKFDEREDMRDLYRVASAKKGRDNDD